MKLSSPTTQEPQGTDFDWRLLMVSKKQTKVFEDTSYEFGADFPSVVLFPETKTSHTYISEASVHEFPLFTNWVVDNPTNFFSTTYHIEKPESDTYVKIVSESFLTPGTHEFVQASIGSELYQKLSKRDKDFLQQASTLFNLGKDVNINRVLGHLKEDLNEK